MSFPKFTVPSGGEFLRDALGNPLPDESLLVLTHIDRLERENAALRETLRAATERLSHHVRLPVPVAPGLYATSAEEKASLEVLVKAWEVLYPKAQP